jgi:hypothetical protein
VKQLLVLLILLGAGCATPTPREDLALFDSPDVRARRNLLAFYYSEADDGTVISVSVPKQGPAESRGELGRKMSPLLASFPRGLPPRWRTEDIPVADAQRELIDGIFAGLPAGTTERTLAAGDLGPDVEVAPPNGPARVRILHVSAAGETKTLTLIKGRPEVLPAGRSPAGESLARLDAMFLTLAVHRLR